MKKLAGVLGMALFISTWSYGQFTKGKILAGGSFNVDFNTNKYKDGGTTTKGAKSTSFNLYPQIGYFFMDNFAAGAGLSLGTSSSKPGATKFTYVDTYLSPFARYYYGKFYGQATLEIGSSKLMSETSGTTTTTKTNGSGWSLAAGYAYLLNEHVAIEPQLGYGLNYSDAAPGTDIRGGLFIKAGLQVYLSK